MWVFIRPRVVRSANEEKAKLGRECCPIHRFDGIYQFPALLQKERQHERQCVAHARKPRCVPAHGSALR
jgi:hypothetical protein